jgi:hypothetical protein
LKYHENPFHGNRVCTFGEKEGRTDRRAETETVMTKVTGASYNYASAPNKLLDYLVKNSNAFDSLYPNKLADRLITVRAHGTELT